MNFEFRFFQSTAQLKELILLTLLGKDARQSQHYLAKQLKISVGMVNNYLKRLSKSGYLEISEKPREYILTSKGTSYMNLLNKELKSDIQQLKNLVTDLEKLLIQKFHINIATISSIGTVIPNMAVRLGLFEKKGFSVNLHTFNDGESLLENFVSKNIDLAFLGSIPAYSWKATGLPIEIVATVNKGGHAVLTKSKKRITKGSTVGIQGEASTTNNLFKTWIKTNYKTKDIDYNSDLKIFVTADIQKLLTEFKNNNIQFLVLREPFVSMALQEVAGSVIYHDFYSKNRAKDYVSNVLVASTQLAEEFPGAVNELLDIFTDTINFINSNEREADLIMAEILGLPEKVIAEARKRTSFLYQRLL